VAAFCFGAWLLSVNVPRMLKNNPIYVCGLQSYMCIYVCINISLSLLIVTQVFYIFAYFFLFDLSVSEGNVLEVIMYNCWVFFFSLFY